MRYLLDILYGVVLVLFSPKIIYRMLRHDRYRSGWSQRLGKVAQRHREKPCIWLHAVSVGEVNATRTLVDRLSKEFGDYEIVISATTDTGLARAKALYGVDYAVFYFPLDLSFVMGRVLKALRPSIILLMELEVWPNLTTMAHERHIPVIVVNGRLSDNSFPKYCKLKFFVRRMFEKVSLVLAQTDEYARRFVDLGCMPEKVIVSSSLKYDTAQTRGSVEGTERLAEQINLGGQRLWVAGGTGPGEEKMVLNAFVKLKQTPGLDDLRLAIVPRKPERFDEVADLIDAAGFSYIRYSALKENNITTTRKPTVILGDTMGDLRKFYALATVVFVGRSLVRMGGSDMMEPTGLGKCTLFGPFTFNFRQAVEALLSKEGAIMVEDETSLFEQTLLCLNNTQYAEHTAANGQAVIRQNQGATQKTVRAIRQFLSQ